MNYVFSLQVIGISLTPHLVPKAPSLSIVHLLPYMLSALCCSVGRIIRLPVGNGSHKRQMSILYGLN